MNPWMRNLLCGGGGGGGGGPVLPPTGRTMLANLTSSLILDEGTGGPTWSRATKAWGFNELGYLEELASGCAFFGGARLVRNQINTTSEDFSNAAWTKSSTTVASISDTLPTGVSAAFSSIPLAATAQHYIANAGSAYPIGSTVIFRVYAKPFGYSIIRLYGPSANCYFNVSSGIVGTSAGANFVSASIVDAGNGWYLCSVKAVVTSASAPSFELHTSPTETSSYLADGISGCKFAGFSYTDVTNYDSSYVPEYVSVGSDTDKNFLLHTDDFSQAAWAKTNITLTQSAIANPVNGLINAQKVEATAGAATQLIQTVTGAGSASGMAFVLYVKKGSGATDMQTFALRNNTTATNVLGGRINYDTGVITYYAGSSGITAVDAGNGWWKLSLISATGFSAGDNIIIYLGSNGSAETAGEFCYIYRPYLGRGITAPAVLPAVAGVWDPFGAGIDGAKYFETDWQGAPIAAANLLRVRREASAINNLLHSRDLSNAAWSTKTNITAAKTATGLDGIANTATTLTAAAADAIILQPITLASAARCASAYVKRRTGTGTISFTQDGGSTWTDITAQINGSTWSRVEITSTLANPSVGFKIGTSGDAIDVDVVQNEAGAVATSPIVTTTTTVTRNADYLAYQTAGNIDFAVGTLYGEILTPPGSSTRYIAGVGTSYSALTSTAVNTWRANDGTNTVTASGLSDVSLAKRKRVVSWGPAGLSSGGDGLAPVTGSFDGSFGDGATISIGANSNGYVGPVAIYNYQMTAAEQQALTT